MTNLLYIAAPAALLSLVLLQLGQPVASSCTDEGGCKADEVCDNDNCYSKASRIDCQDGISYCYKPRQCCGISTCCPEKAVCCGWSTCCPPGSVCCSGPPNYCCESGSTCCGFQTCCAAGSECKDRTCVAKRGGPFKWWYAFVIIFPLVVLVTVIIRRKRRAAQMRAAGTVVQTGQVISVPAPTTENYGYDQPMGNINYQLPSELSNRGNNSGNPMA